MPFVSVMPFPSPRSAQQTIESQARLIAEWGEARALMDAIPDILLAVNANRQIVFANQAAANFFRVGDVSDLWGKRPGEAACCLHSTEVPGGGCGDSEACKVCGAFQAIMKGLEGETPVEECRMLQKDGTPLDLRVWARPFDLGGERFAFLSLQDISNEKRRSALEKIFFHDLMNTVGGLQSIGELMEFSGPEELRELRGLISNLSGQLVDEIRAQRELLAAEQGELTIQMRAVNSRDAVQRTITTYLSHPVCDGKTICAARELESVDFSSDLPLLLRVLGNLAKNALEACPQSGTVEVGCRRSGGDHVEFFVRNPGEIPRTAQLQIFNRSFSTKGSGRGLGTYSVRLLTERFLGGKARFASSAAEQTTFFVEFPIKP